MKTFIKLLQKHKPIRDKITYPTALLCALALLALSTHPSFASAPINITYSLTTSQRVSINIYNSSGQIVRELLHGAARTSGSRTELWDGRDDAGNPVPVGSYSWKMLSTPGFSPEYITSPGGSLPDANTGPFWAAGGPGCHGGPVAIAVDSNGFYVSGGTENIETALLKQSLDGTTRNWSGKNFVAWDTPNSLAAVGTSLWARYANGTIFRQDNTTGDYVSSFDGVYNGEAPSDMAANGTSIVLSYPTAGIVRWLDYTGTQTRSVNVAGAKTIDLAADGTAYVISGTSLLKITTAGTSATTLVSSGLTAPRRAAVNQTNGEIYIVDCAPYAGGQIKRYSSAGVLQQTYGVAGGRTDGLYQTKKTDFAGVSDIAVESDGKFMVVEGERAPRRTARFNKTGTSVNEWYGGQLWAPYIMPEPDNPRYVWVASSWGSLIRCDVDYTAKTWSVHSTYVSNGLADGLISNHDNGEVWVSRMHGGELYLCKETTPTVIKVDRTNWKLMPVTVTEGYIGLYLGYMPTWLQTLYNADPTNRQSLVWRDENGDGRPLNTDGTPQMSELHFSSSAAPYTNSQTPDSDFNYLAYGGVDSKLIRWAATSWNSIGAPVYSTFPVGVVVGDKPPRQTGYEDGRWTAHLTGDASGNIWGAFNPNITGWGASTDSFIARWNSSGALQWQSGRIDNKAGSLGTTRHIYGIINNGTGSDCLVVGRFSYEWSAEGITPVYVYDQDGLYAGPLLGKPTNQGTTPNWRYGLGGEALSGQIMKHTDGNVYFFGNWINEGRVYKITGWTGWQRANGTITVPTGYVAPTAITEDVGPNGTGAGLQGQYYGNDYNWSTTPVLTRIDPTVNFDWSAGNPTGTGGYSVRWTGSLTPRRTGWHMFQQPSGNGSWGPPHDFEAGGIFVNGVSVNNNSNHDGGYTNQNRVIWLEAGKAYPIKLDCNNMYIGGGGASLQWSEPETNGVFNVIPQSQLNPTTPDTGTGLKAQYYNGATFGTLVNTRTDATVNFNWGTAAPMTSVNTDAFSVRWTGKILPTYSQTYTFTTTTDDGVRLWVNNVLLVDKWVNQGATAWTGSIALEAGKQYDIKMEYYDNTGNASAKLEWQCPGLTKQVVPQTSLFAAP